jgi:hypothetical protein
MTMSSDPERDVITFESVDDGAQVLAYVHATPEGQVALEIAHELDGDLELVIEQQPAKELTAALIKAIKSAQEAAT